MSKSKSITRSVRICYQHRVMTESICPPTRIGKVVGSCGEASTSFAGAWGENAEPNVLVPVRWVVPVAIGSSAVPAVVVPVAAPENPVDA